MDNTVFTQKSPVDFMVIRGAREINSTHPRAFLSCIEPVRSELQVSA